MKTDRHSRKWTLRNLLYYGAGVVLFGGLGPFWSFFLLFGEEKAEDFTTRFIACNFMNSHHSHQEDILKSVDRAQKLGRSLDRLRRDAAQQKLDGRLRSGPLGRIGLGPRRTTRSREAGSTLCCG